MVRKTFALAGKGTDCQVGKGLSVNSIDLGKAAEGKEGPVPASSGTDGAMTLGIKRGHGEERVQG